MIALGNSVQRNMQTASRTIDAETLIMNPADSMLHSVNEVGTSIWEYIAERRTVADVIAMVTEQFACSRETAEKDVLSFLNALHEQGLVSV